MPYEVKKMEIIITFMMNHIERIFEGVIIVIKATNEERTKLTDE